MSTRAWEGKNKSLDRPHAKPKARATLASLKTAIPYLLALTLLITPSLATAAPNPVAYTISLSAPEQHLVEVQMTLPDGASKRELQLPAWNALYQIRDFGQYVNWVRAKDRAGKVLPVRKLDKGRWQIAGTNGGAIVQYQIFANAFGPFGAQLTTHHAFFNLAQILMYPVDARAAPMSVHFNLVPEGWRIATPLAFAPDGTFSAEGYDRLVDSPVEIGEFKEAVFNEAGASYRVIVDADPADYDMEKIVGQLRKIVTAASTWMNDRPFDHYMFLYHFPRGPAGGGMEHAYSTAIDLSADALKSPTALSSVTSHEFFHLWNVKRIRPQALEPVDYTKENYTRALWFSEGVTSTAEAIIELRAGLIDEKRYLQDLSEEITELQRRPAHLTQSSEEASLDAWLEGYPYYPRPERSISYYNKGQLVGVLLDLTIRDATHGQASLREVLQWMNQNYAKKGRYFKESDGVREAAENVSHTDLASFFSKYVAGTEEIPWNNFFRSVGLRVIETPNTVPEAGFNASRNFDGPMIVGALKAGGAAERAGLLVGDNVLEIQGKVPGQDSRQDLAELSPGDALTIKIRRPRGGERELKWKMGSRQEISYELKDLETVTLEQRARRAAWLKGEAQSTVAR